MRFDPLCAQSDGLDQKIAHHEAEEKMLSMASLALGCSLMLRFASAWKVQSVGSFIKCDVSGPLKSTGQKIRLREPRGPQIDPKHPKSERPALSCWYSGPRRVER